MSIVLRQLSKLRSILTHRLVALLELQKLNLLLSPNVFRKVPPQKSSPEHSPIRCNTILFHFSPGSNPPVISFLCQHVSTIPHLQLLSTINHSEDPLDLLQPLLSTFRIMCTFEQWRIIPLKIPQLSVSTNTSSLLIPSEHTSQHSQSFSNSSIVSSITSSSHCSVTLQNNLISTQVSTVLSRTSRIQKG